MNLLQVGRARSSGRRLALIGPMVAALAVVVAVADSASASLTTYGFKAITNNTPANAATAGQYFVDVTDEGFESVAFTFRNEGPINSSITDLYWDDGELLGIATLVGSNSGVNFTEGADPSNLPGGNSIQFNTSTGFSADSVNPPPHNGVQPTEWVKITFNLLSGSTYQDVIDAIALSLLTPNVDVVGGLRIGIHVQSIGVNLGSESFVNGPVVPEPSTFVVALVAGIPLGIAGLRRHRRRSQVEA